MRRYLNLLVLSVLVGCSTSGEGFVLRGIVPGAVDSTVVSLAPLSNLDEKITGYVIGEKFELRGKNDRAECYSLVLDDRDIADKKGEQKFHHREIHFFVEDGELTFTTPHIDSLPMPFRYVRHDFRKEKHYKVTGSAVQDIFYVYQQKTIAARFGLKNLLKEFYIKKDVNVYRKWQQEKAELERLSRETIEKGQNLAVSLFAAEELKRDPFMYDQAYLDDLERMFSFYRDTCKALRNFRQYLKDAKVYCRGKQLEDAEILTPDGGTVSLLEQVEKGGYTVIDFWASWCGSCRASFPYLRKLHEKYGDRVKFISLSTDSKDEAWKKAMAEENLPWDEFRCGEKFPSKKRVELYQIKFIPTYLIIDPKGGIVFYSDNCGALELQLESLFE
ncbi:MULTISPECIES: TlpA disulfide reductase family protein [Butyricimonas]|uniref:TlpA disulfide reductase family protein n=1 Tax=Butyricimonas TaxID=574697 RepID=UPI00165240F9|nr:MULTISPECIES: TlpA disulfide reductase family protein [Butyricimonas]